MKKFKKYGFFGWASFGILGIFLILVAYQLSILPDYNFFLIFLSACFLALGLVGLYEIPRD